MEPDTGKDLPAGSRVLEIAMGMVVRPLGFDPIHGHLLYEMISGGKQHLAFVLSISPAGALTFADELAQQAASAGFYDGPPPGSPVN